MRALSRMGFALALWAVAATVYFEIVQPAAPAGIKADLQRRKVERARKLIVKALVVAAACFLISYVIGELKKTVHSNPGVSDGDPIGSMNERLPDSPDASRSGSQGTRPYQESCRF